MFHFPGGLKDYLAATLGKEFTVTREIFAGKSEKSGGHGSLEWAVTWYGGDQQIHSYCNTIPTPEGGTHEAGLRIALTKGLKNYAELTQNKRAAIVTTDDVMISAAGMLSVFIREPEFVGQTKDKLATVEAQRIVENALRDPFDHYLADNPAEAAKLLDWVVERAEERVRRRKEKEVSRKTAVRKLRLPGKLADCAQNTAEGAELFIVEGDSAGGRPNRRATAPTRRSCRCAARSSTSPAPAGRSSVPISRSAISPGARLRHALEVSRRGPALRAHHHHDRRRRRRCAHRLSSDHLLLSGDAGAHPRRPFYLAVPPLYRLSQGSKTLYARDDAHREELMRTEFNGRGKVELGRFKGLGEMLPAQLKETTMDPAKRTLLKVEIDDVDFEGTRDAVDSLMGTKAEARFRFIQERAVFADNLDI